MPPMESEERPRNSTTCTRSVSIPRGGPVFAPDLTSTLTCVPDFESNVLREIESLKTELSSPSSISNDDFIDEDEDISVDELRIVTDEELLSAAMNELFKNEPRPCESSNASSNEASDGGEINGGRVQKRKRQSKSKEKEIIVHDKNNSDDGRYLLIAEEFAKVRERQKEDRTAATLHCLIPRAAESHLKNEPGALLSENSERLESLLSLVDPTKVRPSRAVEQVPINYPETVLSVEIYHRRRTMQKVQEIMVLGSQLLTKLRDKIYCKIDEVMQKAGHHDPSGYFLIEDVFYNDLRDPVAIDYSMPILDWLKNKNGEAYKKWECILLGARQTQKDDQKDSSRIRLPPFKAADMHKFRFCDIKFCLGAGYLYCHQGDCKHTFVIRDMRLIHPEDVQNKAAYPLVSYQLKFVLTKCSICKLYKATKVTLDDMWAGENPCYFCDNCYFLLHYNEDGSLLYDRFSVYEYLQDH